MRTCNVPTRLGVVRGQRMVGELCGKPAVHRLPGKTLVLCPEHAAMNWGTPAPEPLPPEDEQPAAPTA